ncbi:hypothetical protein A2642_02825 [Candidatus Nomurabacteria bacterium RIFCSPHIGHO2_01_FULL_39_10]|uniref:Uncharacterized protein n=1 Tax=Candidatus Nomurabacteria bacterium RIFCSPHIGHO2_01_FULL_39_10 TaxID=1801733 RepID=A0A1F6V550_9BACT|nr:MAG: hypothetical protein A2642_02825 [Candidatus Nomurabacteria bacterium RIFCSPHIGHO2_01_FULL_39_10]
MVTYNAEDTYAGIRTHIATGQLVIGGNPFSHRAYQARQAGMTAQTPPRQTPTASPLELTLSNTPQPPIQQSHYQVAQGGEVDVTK